MNAGLPGTGIGGLFYLLSALWAPVDALGRMARGRGDEVRWGLVLRQTTIALSIIGALWATGWGFGYLLSERSGGIVPGIARLAPATPVENVIVMAAVLGTLGILGLVLLMVQVLRLTVGRPRAAARPGIAPPTPRPVVAEARGGRRPARASAAGRR
jgi:hypothetical protein